jgi:hypothetical protein
MVDGRYLPGTFQPTFLYECAWDLATFAMLLVIERKARLRRGYLFGAYVSLYTLGRSFVEYIRIDPAHRYLGLRLNDWTSVLIFVASTVLLLWRGRAQVLWRGRAQGPAPAAHAAGGPSPAGLGEEGRSPAGHAAGAQGQPLTEDLVGAPLPAPLLAAERARALAASGAAGRSTEAGRSTPGRGPG